MTSKHLAHSTSALLAFFLPLAYLVGCSGSSAAGRHLLWPPLVSGAFAIGGASRVFVVQENSSTNGSISQLPISTNLTATTYVALGAVWLSAHTAPPDGAEQLCVGRRSCGDSTGGQIQVLASGATFLSAPIRTISETTFLEIALDSALKPYAALNTPGAGSTSIVEFPSHTSGSALPRKSIASASTGLGTVHGGRPHVDSADSMFVITLKQSGASTSGTKVLGFGRGVAGNVAPVSLSVFRPPGASAERESLSSEFRTPTHRGRPPAPMRKL